MTQNVYNFILEQPIECIDNPLTRIDIEKFATVLFSCFRQFDNTDIDFGTPYGCPIKTLRQFGIKWRLVSETDALKYPSSLHYLLWLAAISMFFFK